MYRVIFFQFFAQVNRKQCSAVQRKIKKRKKKKNFKMLKSIGGYELIVKTEK